MRPGAQRLAYEVRVYHALVHEYTVGWQSAVGQVYRRLALDVLMCV